MTWLNWLSHRIIFLTTKRNNKSTDIRYVVFVVVFFFFNQSKDNVVLKLTTGYFCRPVGFETKAKNLSFETKAKNLKMCPRERPRGQERPGRFLLS